MKITQVVLTANLNGSKFSLDVDNINYTQKIVCSNINTANKQVNRFAFLFFYSGAFGYFEVTHDITKYTKAAPFAQVGKKTPVAVRFSTVGGESGSADTARDPRGFAVKMYTEEGNWDIVGNNT